MAPPIEFFAITDQRIAISDEPLICITKRARSQKKRVLFAVFLMTALMAVIACAIVVGAMAWKQVAAEKTDDSLSRQSRQQIAKVAPPSPNTPERQQAIPATAQKPKKIKYLETASRHAATKEQLEWEREVLFRRSEGMQHLKDGRVHDVTGIWNIPLIAVPKDRNFKADMLAAELAYRLMLIHAYRDDNARFKHYQELSNDYIVGACRELIETEIDKEALADEVKEWRNQLKQEVNSALPAR
jgi:cell division protein FtsI/penicillin-binding protein 2